MKWNLLLIVLFFGLSSCMEEFVDIDVPQKSKTIIYAFPSADDDQLKVVVSFTKPFLNHPVFNSSLLPVDSLAIVKVKISDGQELTLTYSEFEHCFTSNMGEVLVAPGKTYEIFVQTSKNETFTMNTTVPLEESVNMNANLNFEGSVEQQVIKGDLSLNGFNTQSYYRIMGVAFFNNGASSLELTNAELNGLISGKELLLNNNVTFTGNIFDTGISMDSVVFAVFPCDEAYYKYHKTVLRAQDGSVEISGDPVIIYSNIPGGVGAVGSIGRPSFFTKYLK
ncbi:MAG: DUF4249 family protein [Bacteroidota bacterium]|jgi:hypothetical protein